MEGSRHQEIEPAKDFDISEVSPASYDVTEVIDAGTVEPWRMLEYVEKAKVRPYITGIVLSVWVTSIVASAIRFLITGNFLLIIPSALLCGPLYILMKFYFRSG